MANMNPTDIYVKQISTQMDNNNLKQQIKQDKITILRLQRELKIRDRLISKYLPDELNHLRKVDGDSSGLPSIT